MTIEDMKRMKIRLGMTNEEIAQKAGLPLGTVQKIMSGITKAPRKNTIDAIEEALLQEDRRRRQMFADKFSGRKDRHTPEYRYDLPGHAPDGKPEEAGVCEDASLYSSFTRRRYYTVDDYYSLPDERRAELIDGVFYDMPAPAVIHQKILLELGILFRECADAHDGQCDVFIAPCDVRLDRDDRTIVQPDLFVICGGYDLKARAFDGAPDLTVEILSPSSRSKDMLLKLHKYYQAGVKEYWIVDPEQEKVTVYMLRNDDFYPAQYDFDAVIPIGISDGKCRIDFSKIHKALKKAQYHGRPDDRA